MRCDDLYIAGLARHLPAAVDVVGAVAEGRYDAAEQAANGYVSVTVAGSQAPPEMAARAGGVALERSGVPAGEVALLLHASAWFQGVDYWPAASYVHREVLGGNRRAPALDVAQMCNGALGAVELGASYLAAVAERRGVLVTTADRFVEPGFDRWRGDVGGIVYGDGAAAVVLAREGFARLLAVGTVVDTGLEAMYRGDVGFAGGPGRGVDIRARRRAFMAGTEGVADRTTAGLGEAIGLGLEEAGVGLGEVARFVFPNVGLETLRTRYLEPFGLKVEATAWEWGRRTGHVGAADQLTGLAELVESGVVGPGERVMLVGIGAGFSWTCAVVEVTARPGWL
ncbi:ketoacyl-ACP synthase III family protein [Actinomadura sp. DC4]|uniref:ketoacyl-ACP synthase III family protein n=1 Tax=Actinomadura sp. DC4 TaxID=3055069 RepID=UPI0025B270F5|nr:ketoacyl-ACP synthase III family protein [Actinomadura sp. DC4]MDN3356280.1 ketoacyl-ACP synthase III family protein [Actinomadura sp. DC4]